MDVNVGLNLDGYDPTDDDFADIDLKDQASIDGMFNVDFDNILNNALNGEGNDVGNVINPLIVDGQLHGGIAQGVAQAYYEQREKLGFPGARTQA